MGLESEETLPLDIDLLRLFVHAMQVDGEIAEVEMEKLKAFCRALDWDVAVTDQAIEDEIRQPTPLSALATAITDEKTQQTAIAVCASIVAADGKFAEQEQSFLTELCLVWGFEPDSLIEGVRGALEETRATSP